MPAGKNPLSSFTASSLGSALQALQGLTQLDKSAEGEPLPAGLALLRKLQAQGGVSRRSANASPAPTQHHTIFQDPAVLSATPSPEHGTACVLHTVPLLGLNQELPQMPA